MVVPYACTRRHGHRNLSIGISFFLAFSQHAIPPRLSPPRHVGPFVCVGSYSARVQERILGQITTARLPQARVAIKSNPIYNIVWIQAKITSQHLPHAKQRSSSCCDKKRGGRGGANVEGQQKILPQRAHRQPGFKEGHIVAASADGPYTVTPRVVCQQWPQWRCFYWFAQVGHGRRRRASVVRVAGR